MFEGELTTSLDFLREVGGVPLIAKLLLARMCDAVPRTIHILRSLPPNLTAHMCEALNTRTAALVGDVAGTDSESIPPHFRFPLRWGGLGMCDAARLAPAAYLAGCIAVASVLRPSATLVPTPETAPTLRGMTGDCSCGVPKLHSCTRQRCVVCCAAASDTCDTCRQAYTTAAAAFRPPSHCSGSAPPRAQRRRADGDGNSGGRWQEAFEAWRSAAGITDERKALGVLALASRRRKCQRALHMSSVLPTFLTYVRDGASTEMARRTLAGANPIARAPFTQTALSVAPLPDPRCRPPYDYDWGCLCPSPPRSIALAQRHSVSSGFPSMSHMLQPLQWLPISTPERANMGRQLRPVTRTWRGRCGHGRGIAGYGHNGKLPPCSIAPTFACGQMWWSRQEVRMSPRLT